MCCVRTRVFNQWIVGTIDFEGESPDARKNKTRNLDEVVQVDNRIPGHG
jgi:hypothetical protein